MKLNRIRTAVGIAFWFWGTAGLSLLLTMGNPGKASAELVSSGIVNLAPGYTSGSPLDVNGDGVTDYSLGSTIIGTADVPQSISVYSAYIETAGSNLLMGDDLGGISHSAIGWNLPLKLPSCTYWQCGSTVLYWSSSSLIRGSDPPQYVFSGSSGRWSNTREAYLLGAFEAADGYHAVWFKVTFSDPDPIAPDERGLQIEEWTFESEPFTLRPEDALPHADLTVSPSGDTLRLTRLIAGHRYFIEYSDDSTLANWMPIEPAISAKFSSNTPTLPRRDAALLTRFYRVRHEWVSAFPK
ncbi:MAG: hypothetical protein ACI9R3_000911 [Verrucomicrobiales bacterium]|jgi:hypothetical protein